MTKFIAKLLNKPAKTLPGRIVTFTHAELAHVRAAYSQKG